MNREAHPNVYIASTYEGTQIPEALQPQLATDFRFEDARATMLSETLPIKQVHAGLQYNGEPVYTAEEVARYGAAPTGPTRPVTLEEATAARNGEAQPTEELPVVPNRRRETLLARSRLGERAAAPATAQQEAAAPAAPTAETAETDKKQGLMAKLGGLATKSVAFIKEQTQKRRKVTPIKSVKKEDPADKQIPGMQPASKESEPAEPVQPATRPHRPERVVRTVPAAPAGTERKTAQQWLDETSEEIARARRGEDTTTTQVRQPKPTILGKPSVEYGSEQRNTAGTRRTAGTTAVNGLRRAASTARPYVRKAAEQVDPRTTQGRQNLRRVAKAGATAYAARRVAR
ncbi:MAG TPA: hypothetical protein VD735_06090 [Candidatus Saccharimonadales bacterium]|nr:hypothetical protein [Candidatus Saccharimonadales bacterium]